jgi:hypothetical protein
MPASLTPGDFELRLFTNDGYSWLATSNGFSVAPSNASTTSGQVLDTDSNAAASQPMIPWTDYRLKLKLKSIDDDSIGVIFRFQDNKNYYRFVWNRASRVRRLERIRNGAVEVLAKDSVRYAKGQTYQVEIIANGSTLQSIVDAKQIFSVNDSAFADGKIGLYAGENQGAIFDDVAVEDLATGTLLLSEDFSHGTLAGWTIVDHNLTYGPSAWSAQSGALTQSSNIAGTVALYTAHPWTDYRFETNLSSDDDDRVGVLFRYQDNDHHYRFSWDKQSSSRRLERIENGLPVLLAEDAIPYTTGQTYHLAIDVNGANIEIRIDGALIFSVSDEAFDWGGIGLYSAFNAGSVFDNIMVNELATGMPLFWDNFDSQNTNGWTIVDQTTNGGPSAWSGATGALIQGSNIGSKANSNVLGTIAIPSK